MQLLGRLHVSGCIFSFSVSLFAFFFRVSKSLDLAITAGSWTEHFFSRNVLLLQHLKLGIFRFISG